MSPSLLFSARNIRFPVLLLSKKEQLDVSGLAFFCEEHPVFRFYC